VCPITATLTPTAAYISLSADYSSISIDASKIQTPTDYGTHSMSLTVNSKNFSGYVTQQAFNFNVIITCAVTSLTITSQVPNTTYTL
jgi:hypothetical protein